jgi:uncharacterized membrane protein
MQPRGMNEQTWRDRHNRSRGNAAAGGDALARALGVFSLALGAAQLAAPRRMVNMIGVRDTERNRDTMVGIGLREIVSGLGILGRSQPAGWLQARVGGDVMDLALLGRALQSDHQDRDRVVRAIAAVAGVMALDAVAARRWARQDDGDQWADGDSGDGRAYAAEEAEAPASHGRPVTRSITVRQPPEEVYAFWRNFENLPRFMQHLEAVRMTGDRRSTWRARAPAGMTVEWEAETIEDRPEELIAWRSLPGSSVPNSGQVRFVRAPGGRGTEVHVEMRYDPPGGKLGVVVAKLFGREPAQQVAADLRRFKQVLETGEVVHSDASIHGRPHPAHPPSERQAPRRDNEPAILGERADDAAFTSSSNLDRDSTTARPERRTS